jgi:hypothetical protein
MLLISNFTGTTQVLHDKHWIISNYIQFTFNQNETTTEIIEHSPGLITNPFNTAISSRNGELAFHTSGCFVFNKDCNIMENGGSLNPGIQDFGVCTIGDAIWYQDVIIIPHPGKVDNYILFTLDVGAPFQNDTIYFSLAPLNLYYHEINMNENEGLGSVIKKNLVAISDTLAHGYIQACKHANGRDWWVIVPEWHSNCFYSLYITPDSIYNPIRNCSGQINGDNDFGLQVGFSPDGNWYAQSLSNRNDSIGYINLYPFDRCNGQFGQAISLYFPIDPSRTSNSIGLCFSLNSQYLYVSTYKTLWQFDLMEDTIQNSLILAGKIDDELNPQKGSLYYQQLAPNGEIIIASPYGHKFLSTIHNPNNRGLACNFKAHDFPLPFNRQNYAGLPNYPNYKLGPVDESICDTLGIDNNPISNFKYTVDPFNRNKVDFYNLSYFKPDTYLWDFGDGGVSASENTYNIYSEKGVYNVCLTTSNPYGENTFCQEIDLMTLSSGVLIEELTFSIYPNPANGQLIIYSHSNTEWPVEVCLHNSLGKLVFHDFLFSETTTFNIDHIPNGAYWVNISSTNQKHIYRDKLIKIATD